MRKKLISGLGVLLVAGCVSVPPQEASAQMSLDETMAEAEKKLAMAQEMNAEWMALDPATGGSAQPMHVLLQVAKEKAEKGETDEAMRIAKRVIEFSELGMEQAESQKGSGPSYNM